MYDTVSNYYSSAASNESASATSSADATPLNFTSALVDAMIEDDIPPYHSHVELKQDPQRARAWSPELEQLVAERMATSRPWSGFLAAPVSAQPAQFSSSSWTGPRAKLRPNSRSSSTTSTASLSTNASSTSTSEQIKSINSADYYPNYYHNSYYAGFDPDTKLASQFQTISERNYTTTMTTAAADLPASFGLDFEVDLNLTIPSGPAPFTDNSSSDSSSVSPVSTISTIPALSALTATGAVPTSPSSSTQAQTFTTTESTVMGALAQARTGRRQGHNRNYRCRHCAQVFSDAASLKQHIAQLPDPTVSQRPYKCAEPSCDWHVIGFHRNNDCSRHYRQVHGVREFVCRWEGSRECRTHRFVTAWLRNRHERTVHAGEMESLGLDPDSGQDRSGARKRRKLQDP
ncbi:hypothetical protein V1509DRAFT_641590 [Lipomyces kononenkoae]